MERDLELALVARLRTGDAAAFDAVFEEFNPRLVQFLFRMTRNRAAAEDLVEETWLRLISSAGQLRDDSRLGPWLFTVARNLFLSHCRSRAREQAYTGDLTFLWPGEYGQSPYRAASANESEQRIETALGRLPPPYREVILLIAVEGLRPAEAAKVCGVSPEALRQRLSRARAMLKKLLDGAGAAIVETNEVDL